MSDTNFTASRGGFTSKSGFILAAAGSAVGLGNIWRFPYMTGINGGGAFVLIYVICLCLIGVPLLLVEFSVGRHGKANAIDSYAKINEKVKFIGYIGLFSSPMFLSYYSVVSGWTIYYTVRSFTGLRNVPADVMGDFFGSFISNPTLPLLFLAIFIFLTVYIVANGVSDGIEKYSKILMPILFIFIVILVIRSATLSGFKQGIAWYLTPDFSKITPAVIVAACGQIFFSLSVGMSGMVTYASYLKGDENLIKTAGIVSFFDALVAILAGLVIFPAVFTYGFEPGAGPSLVFITLPAVFNAMPFGSFFAFIFFALLIVANLTSSISILEMPVAYLIEKKGFTRPKAAIFIGVIGFILGIAVSLGFGVWSGVTFFGGMSIFDVMDYLGSNVILPFCGLAAAVAVGWVWNKGAVAEVTNGGTNSQGLGRIWIGLVRYLVPILMAIIFMGQIGIIKLG